MSELTREPSGVLIVNKHAGVTSHDIVGKIRRLYGTRQVGHTGTLDPMATGVLVVLLGRAAKATEYLSGGDKRYIATLRLGLTTDTQDTTGMVLTSSDNIPKEDAVQAALLKKVHKHGSYKIVILLYIAFQHFASTFWRNIAKLLGFFMKNPEPLRTAQTLVRSCRNDIRHSACSSRFLTSSSVNSLVLPRSRSPRVRPPSLLRSR